MHPLYYLHKKYKITSKSFLQTVDKNGNECYTLYIMGHHTVAASLVFEILHKKK